MDNGVDRNDDTNHCLVLFPCVVTLKATTTVMALARTVETATGKTTPNVICWRMQVAVLGQQMKSKERKKPKTREVSRP